MRNHIWAGRSEPIRKVALLVVFVASVVSGCSSGTESVVENVPSSTQAPEEELETEIELDSTTRAFLATDIGKRFGPFLQEFATPTFVCVADMRPSTESSVVSALSDCASEQELRDFLSVDIELMARGIAKSIMAKHPGSLVNCMTAQLDQLSGGEVRDIFRASTEWDDVNGRAGSATDERECVIGYMRLDGVDLERLIDRLASDTGLAADEVTQSDATGTVRIVFGDLVGILSADAERKAALSIILIVNPDDPDRTAAAFNAVEEELDLAVDPLVVDSGVASNGILMCRSVNDFGEEQVTFLTANLTCESFP